MSLLFKTVYAQSQGVQPGKVYDVENKLGETFFNYNTTTTLTTVFQNTINFLFSLAIFFVILFLAFSGFQFITSAGDKAKLDNAKSSFKYSMTALALLAGLWLVILLLKNFFAGGSASINSTIVPSVPSTSVRN